MRFDFTNSEMASADALAGNSQPKAESPETNSPTANSPESVALELSLPDDLQLLAEQLGDDALHLAALYPPKASEAWAVAAAQGEQDLKIATASDQSFVRRSRWGILKWGIAAASLLLTSVIAWNFRPTEEAARPIAVPLRAEWKQPSITAESKMNASTHDLSYHSVSIAPSFGGMETVEGTVKTELTPVPTGLFINLSTPEQEALLDVMEDEKLQQASVSF